MAGAIAPDTAPRWDPDRPGAKVPGQRPTRPWRALACCCSRTCRSTANCSARAGKCGSRFLAPPEGARALSPRQWQGPSPLPQRRAGIRTGRGPKPPASARPAHGGRFPPAGSGAGLRCSMACRSTGHRPARAGDTRCVSWSRPERRKHCHRCNGRGHRPCHDATLASGPAGGQSPRRALRPRRVGRWPFVVPGPTGLQGTVPRGRGNAGRVSCSRPEGRKQCHRLNGRGHRPCHSATLSLDPPGAKAPSQRPTRPRRALASAGPGPAGLQGTVPHRRGNAVRFLFPPEGAIPFPASGRVAPQAGGRIAVSAPCQGSAACPEACGRLRSLFFLPRLPPSGLGKTLGLGTCALRQPDRGNTLAGGFRPVLRSHSAVHGFWAFSGATPAVSWPCAGAHVPDQGCARAR